MKGIRMKTIKQYEAEIKRLKRKGEQFETLSSRLFSERNSLEAELIIAKLKEKNENLVKALEYYADKENHYHHAYDCDVSIAVKALKENEK